MFKKLLRRMKKYLRFRGIRFKVVICFMVCMLFYFGALTHIFEVDYSNFSYPLEGDISKCVKGLENNLTECKIINPFNFKYILNNDAKCLKNTDGVKLVIIIKSAASNFQRRIAIRHSWGYEGRFSDIAIKTLFNLGMDEKFQSQIKVEHEKYKDIIQANFVDSYYNNTFKTISGFKWCMEYCRDAKFYLFVDDDMYVSVKNVLYFVRNPTEYPHYLISRNGNKSHENYIYDMELAKNVKLFAGNVVVASPHRHLCGKWYISLSDYPFNLYPPYVNAGAYILSQKALSQVYYASYFTKNFKFDDVYLGILAKKTNLELYHCSDFNFYEKPYNKFDYNYTIVSHGYGDPHKLLKIWNEQKSIGNA